MDLGSLGSGAKVCAFYVYVDFLLLNGPFNVLFAFILLPSYRFVFVFDEEIPALYHLFAED